jgi:hypothetical protein
MRKRSSSVPELTVIALHGELPPLDIRVQFFLAGKGQAVNAREHGTFFVPPPIAAGNAVELETAFRHLAGVFEMWAFAHVGEGCGDPLDLDSFRGGLS